MVGVPRIALNFTRILVLGLVAHRECVFGRCAKHLFEVLFPAPDVKSSKMHLHP